MPENECVRVDVSRCGPEIGETIPQQRTKHHHGQLLYFDEAGTVSPGVEHNDAWDNEQTEAGVASKRTGKGLATRHQIDEDL